MLVILDANLLNTTGHHTPKFSTIHPYYVVYAEESDFL